MIVAEPCNGPRPPAGELIPLIASVLPKMLNVMSPDGRIWRYGLSGRSGDCVEYAFFYGLG
ncbi:MAG: hypothetical protein DLM63_02830 [Solirubrobacterales bacterium]|nr:MAG: hypothetical protein DLM63_02830 [Solirubrobacterales bacterium]